MGGRDEWLRLQAIALAGEGGAFGFLLRDKRRIGARIGGKLREVGVELRELLDPSCAIRARARGRIADRNGPRPARARPQRDVDPAQDLAAVRRHHEPAIADVIGGDVDPIGLGCVEAQAGDRKIDAADVAHEPHRGLLRRSLDQCDHDLRALLAEVGDGCLPRRDQGTEHQLAHVVRIDDGVRGDDAEDADGGAADLDDLRRHERWKRVVGRHVDRLARQPELLGALREIRGAEPDRGDLQLLRVDVGEQVGFELFLRIELGWDRALAVEQRARIDEQDGAFGPRVGDQRRGPRDVSERIGGAAARPDLAADLGEREHGERRLGRQRGVRPPSSPRISSSTRPTSTSASSARRPDIAEHMRAYSTLTVPTCPG